MDPIVYWEQTVYHGVTCVALSIPLRRDCHGRVYYRTVSGQRGCVVRSGNAWELSHTYTGEDGHQ